MEAPRAAWVSAANIHSQESIKIAENALTPVLLTSLLETGLGDSGSDGLFQGAYVAASHPLGEGGKSWLQVFESYKC